MGSYHELRRTALQRGVELERKVQLHRNKLWELGLLRLLM